MKYLIQVDTNVDADSEFVLKEYFSKHLLRFIFEKKTCVIHFKYTMTKW